MYRTRRVTSAVLLEGVQGQESHICSTRGGFGVTRKSHICSEIGGVQYQESQIRSTRGGCAIPRESHLQYQQKVMVTGEESHIYSIRCTVPEESHLQYKERV